MTQFDIMMGIITLVSALVTGFLIPFLKAKTGAENYSKAVELIKTAVMAAEQIYIGEDKAGEKKMEYVKKFLEWQNIKLTDDEIKVLIEAAVLELNKI